MDIEGRVAKLERSLRRWKVFAVAAVCLAVGMAADGEGAKDVVFDSVKAKNFQAIDENGRPVGILTASKTKDRPVANGLLMLIDPEGDGKEAFVSFFESGKDPYHRTMPRTEKP